jgi:hypothetical protein
VGWFAEANGEEVILPDGRVFCPAAGSIIQIAEWYGTKEPGSNKGLVMSARKVAEGIVEREEAMMAGGWIKSKPWAGPADNQIRNVIEDDSDTIEEKMAGAGVRWTQSDKSAGSRKNGLELIRNRLEASITGEGPGLYFMQNCITSVGGLPTLPRDEDDMDDVDTEAEDHFYDMLRYRVLKGNNRMARSITVRYVS